VAFLDRWPTVPGEVLVAPKAHIEQVVRDFDEAAFSSQSFVRGVQIRVADLDEQIRAKQAEIKALRQKIPVRQDPALVDALPAGTL
jgi:diadenosine tetraphosphate (Ap4A) HIT family hydrolase